VIDKERAPNPFRQDRGGDFFVWNDLGAGAPTLQVAGINDASVRAGR
jgi:hypothetical protein